MVFNNNTITFSYVFQVTSSVDGSAALQKSQETSKVASVSALSGLSGTTGSNSTSTDSERTYRVDSQDSQVSDTETSGDRHWPRQNSVLYSFVFIHKRNGHVLMFYFLLFSFSCLCESGTFHFKSWSWGNRLVKGVLVQFTEVIGMVMLPFDFSTWIKWGMKRCSNPSNTK